MRKHFFPVLAVLPVAALWALPCLAATHARHAAGSTRATLAHATISRAGSSHISSSHAAASHAARGRHAERAERMAPVHHEAAPAMDAERATAIQAALIRAGYLSGQPSGVWDAESVAAMQKLQDENGWQTKYTPDSRALLKLGLGGPPLVPSSPAPVTEAATVTPAAQP